LLIGNLADSGIKGCYEAYSSAPEKKILSYKKTPKTFSALGVFIF
jgi:hypothetical protein